MLTTRLAGTDVYHATKDAEKAVTDRLTGATTQHGQDTAMVSSARSALGSAATGAFGSISSAAPKALPGSGAALAGGYGAIVNALSNRFGGPSAFQSPAPVPTP